MGGAPMDKRMLRDGLIRAIRIMHARGCSNREIMDRLGATYYEVRKYASGGSERYGSRLR